MEHCRLAGLMDFNQTDENGVNANKLYTWINALVSNYSVDGLRVDTVPYVKPEFWLQFEASAGVYAVGEVDSGDIDFVSPFQAPNGDDGALSGILSYPMFYTIRYYILLIYMLFICIQDFVYICFVVEVYYYYF